MRLCTADRKLSIRRATNEEKAVAAHQGYIDYVMGKVRKYGLHDVLTTPDYCDLRDMYMRVISWAEQIQLRRILSPVFTPSQRTYFTVVTAAKQIVDNNGSEIEKDNGQIDLATERGASTADVS